MKDSAGAVLFIVLVRAQHWEASTPLNERLCWRGFVHLASARSALGGVDAVE